MYHVLLRIDDIDKKERVETSLHFLDVQAYSQYNDVLTHCIMDKFIPTKTVLLAMIQGLHIVNIYYFEHVLNQKMQNKEHQLRPTIDFPPDININIQPMDLQPQLLRRSLFKGKTFCFINTTDESQYSEIIQSAGGTSLLITTVTEELSSSNFIVLYNSNIKTRSYHVFADQINEYLKLHSKRTIQLPEVPFAIFKTSIAKYCNPDYLGDLLQCDSKPNQEHDPIARFKATLYQTISSIGGIDALREKTSIENQAHEIFAYMSNVRPESLDTIEGDLTYSDDNDVIQN